MARRLNERCRATAPIAIFSYTAVVDPSAYKITISRAAEMDVDEDLLRRAVEAALRRHAAPAAEIDVAVVNDEQIAELNEAHLGHQGPTDVLTFDLRDSGDAPAIEGQIILSIDTARREASERGHSLGAELALYAIHGTLHLLGHDDHAEDDAAAMHRLEDELLAQLGLGRVYHRP